MFKNAPFGYRKEGERKEKRLVVEEAEAKIVNYIYNAYLKNTPLYVIKEKAVKLGLTTKGNMAIERILTNPVYAGLLKVDPYKEYEGGLFKGIHEAIIDTITWKLVQEKLKRPATTRTVIDDEIPLRGILKCHCGQPLSGAPSRGKSGKYFYYYKCKHSKHNNISAIKSHEQFLGICELMSLPTRSVTKIRTESKSSIDKEMESNRKKAAEKKIELEETEEKLLSVEEKWIKNEINKDTYNRWHSIYNTNLLNLKGAVERLTNDQSHAFKILEDNLSLLTDLKHVYLKSDTLQKRQFVNLVFDSNLYYENRIYRTPTMLNILSGKHLIMKKKSLLEEDPLSGE